MKFTELKQSLKQNIKPAYLLVGTDTFLINKSYNLILDACNLNFIDMNLIKFESDSIDMYQVEKALNTMPMMSDRKVVYVNYQVKNGAILNLKVLLDYLNKPNEACVLIIAAGENGSDFKDISSKIETVICDKLTENFIGGYINAELKKVNKTISPIAVSTLVNYCVFDMSKITSELEKLIAYVGNNSEISVEDVKLNVNKSLEFQVFDLTENLAKRNGEMVFKIIEQIKSKKDQIKIIMPLIYNHFRRLFHVSISKRTSKDISNLLNVKEYAITMAAKQCKLFTKKQLKEINDLCLNMDYEMKIGNMSASKCIDYIALKILNM